MSHISGKAVRFATAAMLATGIALTGATAAHAAGCSGSYALNSAANYSGGWFQIGSAPANDSVNRYTGSAKNNSNCLMTMSTANGRYFIVAHGGIGLLGVYVYSVSI